MTMSKTKPFLVLFVVAALVLTFLVAQMSAQDSPVVPDIGFEIEGNAALDNGGVYDWENADRPPVVLIQDPNSKATTDLTTFRPNSKFDAPEKWSIVPGQVGPGQNELTNVLAWVIPPGDLPDGRPDELWLVLGMERTKQEGTFDLDFEFNQVPWDGSSGGLIRTPGDLVVGFELKGNPTDKQQDLQVLILQYYLPEDQPSLCKVTPGVGNEPALVEVGDELCPPYGDSGWYYRVLSDGAVLASSGLGQATMNEDPFLAPWDSTDAQGNPRSEIGPFQFAEAALNLTELGIEARCSVFSTVHAKSRSSLEVESDLKDLAGPIPLEIMCRLDGHKFLDVNGNGLWDQPDEMPLEGWEITLSDGSTAVTDAEGYYEFEGLIDGTYTVQEVCPESWVQSAPGFTDFDTCGDEVYTVDINLNNREENDLDFGNGQPRLDLTKTCTSDVFLGDDVDYEITVTNSGNVLLEGIVVEDPFIGLDETIDLAPGAFETFTGRYTSTRASDSGGGSGGGPFQVYLPLVMRGTVSNRVTNVPLADDITNTATATTNYALATVTASDSCVTTVHELEVAKTAQPSVERQYFWTLTKTVDNPGPIVLWVSDFTEVEYTVTAGLAEPPVAEGAWTVEGTITIDNPAPIDAVLSSVSDLVSPDIVAAVTCPSLTVPQGGSLTCTYGPVPLPDDSTRTNTATVTLINNNGDTTDFGDTADVDFAQAIVNEIDAEVEVTDEFRNLPPEVLGTIRFDEAPVDFTYTRKITVEVDICELFVVNNTATLVTADTGTVLTDSAPVEVFELCKVTLGYEDLPRDAGNDWDYNDLVVDVEPYLDVSPEHDLLSVTWTVIQMQGAGPTAGMTAFVHTFHFRPEIDAFSCDGTYTLNVLSNGGTTTETGTYTRGDDFLLIPNTGEPPDEIELRIDFDVPAPGACPFDLGGFDPISEYHGEWLFFDPWLYIDILPPQEIHVLRAPEPLAPEPRILTVPVDWDWPQPDGNPVWNPYPQVLPPNPAAPGLGPIFTQYWWRTP